ncbi:MAG: hypothetical protein HC830_11295 [Bacteroidetes bacterium]|nr:hypothetical protein [Bacteroidota bacterium]
MTKLTSDLAGILANAGSFDYPFDSLKLIGKIKSPDNAFRIFTWNIFLSNETFKNFGIIQVKPEKDKNCQVIILHDNTHIDSVNNSKLSPGNWYGALYYRIIPVRISGIDYYTLLGLDSYSPYISKKIIDVLYFDQGRTVIGAPIYNIKGKLHSRMIFSYSARISMMLNYDEMLKSIVFDHLAPSESRYTGQYEFYGPDFSFDGLIFKENQWVLVEDVKPNRPARSGKKDRRPSSNKL